jgi:hypothetical protein
MESKFSDITKETPFARDSVKNGSDDINSGKEELALDVNNRSNWIYVREVRLSNFLRIFCVACVLIS